MQDAILLLLGGFIGLVVFWVPSLFWLESNEQLDKEAFKSVFPQKVVVYYLYKLTPLAWLVVYPVIIFPIIATIFDTSSNYFVGYLALSGFGALDGFLEFVTGVSPIRGGRGALRLRYLVVDDSVRRIGLLRIGLIGGIGLLSWLIIYVLI